MCLSPTSQGYYENKWNHSCERARRKYLSIVQITMVNVNRMSSLIETLGNMP